MYFQLLLIIKISARPVNRPGKSTVRKQAEALRALSFCVTMCLPHE